MDTRSRITLSKSLFQQLADPSSHFDRTLTFDRHTNTETVPGHVRRLHCGGDAERGSVCMRQLRLVRTVGCQSINQLFI